MMSSRKSHHFVAAAVVVVLSSCGGDAPSTSEPLPKPLTIVAGASVTDTVNTRLTQALVVEVRNGNTLAAGVAVRFEAVPPTNPPRPGEVAIRVAPATSNQFSQFASDVTDVNGRARVVVQLGDVAGPAAIRVSVPDLSLVDTARYTVTPGNPVQVSFVPADTLVLAGGSYSLTAVATDFFGNRRTDGVTFAAVDPSVSIDQAGVVRGLSIGRGRITARFGNLADTARVSVVPDLTVVGVGADNASVVVQRLDGSARKKLATIGSTVVLPHFNPAGTTVVFYEGSPGLDAKLYLVDLNGARTQLPTGSLLSLYFPTWSTDGFLYFTVMAPPSSIVDVWRMLPDGTEPTKITSSGFNGPSQQPDISPNAGKMLFTQAGTINVMDLATRTSTPLGVSGSLPRFSPDGSKLVYISSSAALTIVNVDGTNARTLPNRFFSSFSAPSWTPDGNWILLSQPTQPSSAELISQATFASVPLPTLRLTQISIKP